MLLNTLKKQTLLSGKNGYVVSEPTGHGTVRLVGVSHDERTATSTVFVGVKDHARIEATAMELLALL